MYSGSTAGRRCFSRSSEQAPAPVLAALDDGFEERHVALRDGVPRAFALHPRRGRARRPGGATSGRVTSRFRYSKSVSSSVASTGTLRQMSSGYSVNDPMSETIDGLAEAERAQQRPGAFAYGRIAQVQDDVAGGDVPDEVLDGREAQDPNAVADPERVDGLRERQIRMRFADQDHLRAAAPRAAGGGRLAAIR